MNTNFKCKNLTDTSITIQIDNITYKMLPKGFVNDKGENDVCEMRPDHVEDPKVQAFLLCNPPKLDIIPIKKINNSEDIEKIFNKTLDETNEKIRQYKEKLNKTLTLTVDEFRGPISTFMKQLDSEMLEVRGKIDEVIKQVSQLKEEIDNINIQKQERSNGRPSRKSSANNLFN